MIEDITLLAGIDILFPSSCTIIHQPKIKEIALIGEDNFFLGCKILAFSKSILNTEDKTNLVDYSDFDILMTILDTKDEQAEIAFLVLQLFFPNAEIESNANGIVVNNKEVITESNFDDFKEIINKIICLDNNETSAQYKPKGKAALAIAEKLKKGREKVANQKKESGEDKIDLLSRYVSILSVGLSIGINELMDYTIYQLQDNFRRFQLYTNSDIVLKAKLAGASEVEDADNWMESFDKLSEKNDD